MKKIIFVLLIILLVLVISVFITYKLLTMPVSKNIEEKEITIPMGSGISQIANILKEKNLIKNELAFKIYVKLNKISDFQAGTYYLRESMELSEIAEMLQTGIMHDPNQITITYLEGKPMWWLVERIAEQTDNTQEEIYGILNDEDYINSLIEKYWFLTEEIKKDAIYYPLEGYLFPDTYAISDKDCDAKEIFGKMLDKMEKVLEDYKTEIEESDYTVHQLITLASIVETEGMNDEDRKDVASVFYNRLNLGMSLGSDVTTYYAVKINMGDRDLYQSEIYAYNPYNTRGPDMEGKLPVGPIASVGKASIEAAIEPNNTDYLYFVADKNGKIHFTKSYSEHNSVIDDLKGKGLWYEY